MPAYLCDYQFSAAGEPDQWLVEAVEVAVDALAARGINYVPL